MNIENEHKILRNFCNKHKVLFVDVLSGSSKHHLVDIRVIYMLHAHIRNISSVDIAKVLNLKSHASVLYHLNIYESRYRSRIAFRKICDNERWTFNLMPKKFPYTTQAIMSLAPIERISRIREAQKINEIELLKAQKEQERLAELFKITYKDLNLNEFNS